MQLVYTAIGLLATVSWLVSYSDRLVSWLVSWLVSYTELLGTSVSSQPHTTGTLGAPALHYLHAKLTCSLSEMEQALPSVEMEQALPSVEMEQALPSVEMEQALPSVEMEQALPSVVHEKPVSGTRSLLPGDAYIPQPS